MPFGLWGGDILQIAATVANIVRKTVEAASKPVPEIPTKVPETLPAVDFLKAVKLIHCDQLKDWANFPSYEECDLISLGRYHHEKRRLRDLEVKHVEWSVNTKKLAYLDSDEPVECGEHILVAPLSILWKPVRVPLPARPNAEAWALTSLGSIEGGHVLLAGRWWRRRFYVRFRCPRRDMHARDISELRAKMSRASPDDLAEIDELRSSQVNQPVLFISHRWLSPHHPDPNGAQLSRLKLLHNCFLIYDYTSFPQLLESETSLQGLKAILVNMEDLLHNVVILASDDYVERGWCIFEYLTACLGRNIVCDEVQDPRFVTLRNWSATRAPTPVNPFHDSRESMMRNKISAEILNSVNALTPLFADARFGLKQDRATVSNLLVAALKRRLPSKRQLAPQGGETNGRAWTDNELTEALRDGFAMPELDTLPVDPFSLDVAGRLEDAIERGFSVTLEVTDEYRTLQLLNPFADWNRYFDNGLDQPVPPV